jgi:hypothetical protein
MADQRGADEIHAWVEAHRASLPRSLEQLARYPVAYRAAIVRALPAPARVAVWREHFASFLGPGSPLSAPQRAFVQEALGDLPTLMADDLAAAQARGRELEERMAPLFSRWEAGRVFGTLGPPEPPGGLPAPGP